LRGLTELLTVRVVVGDFCVLMLLVDVDVVDIEE
jgi:hypothetical protein